VPVLRTGTVRDPVKDAQTLALHRSAAKAVTPENEPLANCGRLEQADIVTRNPDFQLLKALLESFFQIEEEPI